MLLHGASLPGLHSNGGCECEFACVFPPIEPNQSAVGSKVITHAQVLLYGYTIALASLEWKKTGGICCILVLLGLEPMLSYGVGMPGGVLERPEAGHGRA